MSERLGRTIRRRSASKGKLKSEPVSVYEVITRQMVEEFGRQLRDVRKRIDTLLFVVIAAIVLDLVMRLTGAAG